ncbi:hypothetical protein EDC04DRAFT_2155528 [Pisolithus marmoratus]|nr:hypothetical protein EDC04DRAFT_2155528 [Pisolithus marmoratus]
MTLSKRILTTKRDDEKSLSCLGENDEGCDQRTSAHSRRDTPEKDGPAKLQDPDSSDMISSNEISPNVLALLNPSCTTGSQVNPATPHAVSAPAWLPPLKLLNFTDVPGRPLLHVPETPEGLNGTCIPQPVQQTYAEARRTPTETVVVVIVLSGAVLLATTIRVIVQRRRKRVSAASLGTFERSTTTESGILNSSPVFGGRDRYARSLRSSNSYLLAWAPYQSRISKPEPAAMVIRRTSGDVEASAEIKHTACSQGEVVNKFSLTLCANCPPTRGGNVTSRNKGNAIPLLPPQIVTTDAASRLSMMTVPSSPYPNTSNCSRIGPEISSAVSTSDGEQPREGPMYSTNGNPPTPTMELVTDTTSRVFPVATYLKPNGVGRGRIKATYTPPPPKAFHERDQKC